MSTARQKEKTKNLFMRVIKRSLALTEKMNVSGWAEKYRVLDNASNLKGKWSNDVTPYLNEIMDSLVDEDIRKIYFCKASQVGGTEALINMLGYIIMMDPSPAMIVYPSDDLAKDISTEKLKPAFRLIPEINRIFNENASKELKMKFQAMTLYLRGAGSPSKLASKEIKYLFFDEIDKMGGASKKEASPYNLALERTKTYKGQEKVYACSTPTLKDNYIWDLHDNADEVRHYFVPCPHCHEFIELKWKQIIIPDKEKVGEISITDAASTAVYICQECGCEIENADKPKMLREGKWVAVKKRGIGKAKSVGFWINSLYSIFLNWEDIAEEFMKSEKDPEKLQNFTNSWLGECWEDTQLKTTEDTVSERQTALPEFVIPKWAKMLTGGVDIQETSMYYTIRAYGSYTTSQNITHGQVLSFHEIEDVMNREYITEDGRKMVVALALIDSGYQADATYDFCLDNSDWARPVKGSSNPMDNRYKISKVDKQGSKAYGMELVIVDGSQYKDSIAARMKRQNGTDNGSWMVFKGCDMDYAKQVTSEHKVFIRLANGKKVKRWVQKHHHADNHYLDCEVYSMAAAEMLGIRQAHLSQVEDSGNHETHSDMTKEEQEEWLANESEWFGGEEE